MDRVADIRAQFVQLKKERAFIVDKTGCDMLEIIGATFIADEDAIFGTVNHDYVQREIQWYETQSLNVYDIPGGPPPREWIRSATPDGRINSNYGWAIWNNENHSQYDHVKQELLLNPTSRRATMIYTRPNMWIDHCAGGMSDFMCTNAVQAFIRDGKLDVLVQMRSNDAVFGYKNDRAWQCHIQKLLADDLNLPLGRMIWHVGSLHVYSRHHYLIDGESVSDT